MTDTPTPRVIIRYKNRARALVTVTEHEAVNPARPNERFTAECAGCLDSKSGDFMPAPVRIRDARTWAAEHAGTCRALPQPTEQD